MPLSEEDKSGTLFFFHRRGEEERPEPAPGLAAGKVVGDFRLVSLIGQGGMGQVWEAEQLSLKRPVAVKFVRPDRNTSHQLELFAREARAGGRLSHAGIVAVYGHGQSEGLSWIAMELVSGAWTLKDFLDEATRAPEVPDGYDRHVARFVAEVADAMQAAHVAAVIHRDLKPQNVLITPDEHPKVTDFGLARITDESALSATGDFAGTYFYMSPEQVAARRAGIDHRTDVFSLGVVLYELLALRRPFEGDTSHQVAAQILAKDPPDIRTIRSRVPRDLAVIAGKALEKDRDKRFQTMRDFAADLRRHLANEPIQARPPTRLERVVKWARRNPGKSSAATIVAVTFTVIALLLVANVRTNRALTIERTNLAGANKALEAKTAESEERRVTAEGSAQREREAADLAKSNERLATERADDVLRLSALQKLDDLVAEADRLWPAVPENLPKYETWLAKARELMAELPDHERKLAELRSRAVPWTEEEQAKHRAEPPKLAELESAMRQREHHEMLRAEWLFTDAQDKWWHNQLEKLVNGLKSFADERTGIFSDGTSPENGWGIPKRVEFARTIAERSTGGAEASAKWKEAVASIADAKECPVYGGLRITPQLGLFPIGRDPASGLWEFAHLQTGVQAQRGPDGKLILNEEPGLVFVLLPGGTFRMGCQSADPLGENYDPQAGSDEGPVHAVTLTPYFLSKYEMTQGQWSRFVGSNPSFHSPGRSSAKTRITLLHPVEQVSWSTCDLELGRLGLLLPSEAQWEYACRAGTSTPWSPGDTLESLRGYANIADEGSADANEKGLIFERGFSDGWDVHCPIGALRPNAFGLHEMHGNVWEWCLDGYQKYCEGPQMDPVSDPLGSAYRVLRGGHFFNLAFPARSANRSNGMPSSTDIGVGLRPAKALLAP